MITASALATALTAATVGVYGRTIDRQMLLIAAVAAAGAGNALAAIAPNYPVLLAARVAVGVGSGGFWGIAAGVAPLLVPSKRVPHATAVIFGAAAAASAVGVPVTAAIGTVGGWRVGTVVLAGLSAVATAALVKLVPRLVPAGLDEPARVRPLARVLADVRGVLIVASVVVVGHFAAFTFARPVLEQISGVPTAVIPVLLAGFGVAGVFGSAWAGRYAGPRPRRSAQLIAACMAAAVVAIGLLQDNPLVAAALLCLWGAGYGALGVTGPLWLHAVVGEDHGRASAIYIAVFNGSIAVGAALGGVAVDIGPHGTMRAPLVLAVCLITLGVAVAQGVSRSKDHSGAPTGPGEEVARTVR